MHTFPLSIAASFRTLYYSATCVTEIFDEIHTAKLVLPSTWIPCSNIYVTNAFTRIHYSCRGQPNGRFLMQCVQLCLSGCDVVCLWRVCIYDDRSIFWNWTGGSATAKPGTMLLKPISHGAHLLSHPSSSIYPSIHELFLLIIWSLINWLSGFILPSLQLCFLDFNFFRCTCLSLYLFNIFKLYYYCTIYPFIYLICLPFWHIWSSQPLSRHKGHSISLF